MAYPLSPLEERPADPFTPRQELPYDPATGAYALDNRSPLIAAPAAPAPSTLPPLSPLTPVADRAPPPQVTPQPPVPLVAPNSARPPAPTPQDEWAILDQGGVPDSWFQPAPPPEKGFFGKLGQAFGGGVDTMQENLKATGNLYLGDNRAVEANRANMEPVIAQRPENLKAFYKQWDATPEDAGFFENALGAGKAIIDQPQGLLQGVAEQIPNMLPTMGSMVAGGAAGAAMGSAFPVVGTILGGALGTLAGAILGNTSIETGAAGIEKAEGGLTNQEAGAAIKEGAIRGGVIGTVDTVTLKLNKLLMGAPGRLASKAITNTLAKAGVDVADEAAMATAMTTLGVGSEALLVGARELARSAGRAPLRTAAGAVLETVSEGAGEYAAGYAATGQGSIKDALMESIMSAPMSAAELVWAKSDAGQPLKLESALSRATGTDMRDPEAVDRYITTNIPHFAALSLDQDQLGIVTKDAAMQALGDATAPLPQRIQAIAGIAADIAVRQKLPEVSKAWRAQAQAAMEKGETIEVPGYTKPIPAYQQQQQADRKREKTMAPPPDATTAPPTGPTPPPPPPGTGSDTAGLAPKPIIPNRMEDQQQTGMIPRRSPLETGTPAKQQADNAPAATSPLSIPVAGSTRIQAKQNANGEYFELVEDGVGRYQTSYSNSGIYNRYDSELGRRSDTVMNSLGEFVDASDINRRSDNTDPETTAYQPRSQQEAAELARLAASERDIELSVDDAKIVRSRIASIIKNGLDPTGQAAGPLGSVAAAQVAPDAQGSPLTAETPPVVERQSAPPITAPAEEPTAQGSPLTAPAPQRPDFTPTHSLSDGTPVRATAQPGVYEDADGAEIEDNYADPLPATTQPERTAPRPDPETARVALSHASGVMDLNDRATAPELADRIRKTYSQEDPRNRAMADSVEALGDGFVVERQQGVTRLLDTQQNTQQVVAADDQLGKGPVSRRQPRAPATDTAAPPANAMQARLAENRARQEAETATARAPDEAPQNAVDKLPVVEVPLERLQLSRDVPQFKQGANDSGVVEPLGGKFDRTGVAPIQVWERLDGRQEVISGRHRLDLARRSGETSLPAQVHREADGFDKLQASALDASLNIRDGQGKVIDYVNYFKTRGLSYEQAQAEGLVARNPGKRSHAIANNGGDTLIAQIRAGGIADTHAEEIANAAPGDDALQAVALDQLNKGRSPAQAIATLHAVKSLAAPAQNGQQVDLFGFDDSQMQAAERMGAIAARKQREITADLQAINGANKNPTLAAKYGVNVDDPESLKTAHARLKTEREAWTTWATNPDLVAQVRAEAGVTGAPPALTLQPESEADLRAKDAAEQARQQSEAQADAAAAAKQQADLEVDSFNLESANLNPNQNDLFASLPPAPTAPAASTATQTPPTALAATAAAPAPANGMQGALAAKALEAAQTRLTNLTERLNKLKPGAPISASVKDNVAKAEAAVQAAQAKVATVAPTATTRTSDVAAAQAIAQGDEAQRRGQMLKDALGGTPPTSDIQIGEAITYTRKVGRNQLQVKGVVEAIDPATGSATVRIAGPNGKPLSATAQVAATRLVRDTATATPTPPPASAEAVGQEGTATAADTADLASREIEKTRDKMLRARRERNTAREASLEKLLRAQRQHVFEADEELATKGYVETTAEWFPDLPQRPQTEATAAADPTDVVDAKAKSDQHRQAVTDTLTGERGWKTSAGGYLEKTFENVRTSGQAKVTTGTWLVEMKGAFANIIRGGEKQASIMLADNAKPADIADQIDQAVNVQVDKERVARGVALKEAPAPNAVPAITDPAWGANNTLITRDQMDELRKRAKAKLGQLNAGLDPEMLTIMTQMAAFHLEAGVRRFADFARTMAADLDTDLEQLRVYLRGAYNGARDLMEDSGLDVAELDNPDTVKAELGKLFATTLKTETTTEEQANDQAGAGAADQGGERQGGGGTVRGRRSVADPNDRPVARDPAQDGSGVGTAGDTGGVRAPAAGAARADRGPVSAGRDGVAGQPGTSQSGLADQRTGDDGRPAGGRDTPVGDGGQRAPADEGQTSRPAPTPAPSHADTLAAQAENFHAADPRRIYGGTPKERFRKNQRAIELYRQLEETGRAPTAEEQETLAGYTGFGSFGQDLFKGTWERAIIQEGWTAENEWLRNFLGESEWKSAQASIINAHYTDPPSVQAIWAGVRQLGFTGGRVLEPSAGIGNFFAMMPLDTQRASTLTGIELDELTAGMLKLLYPEANIQQKPYQDSQTPDNFYDLVIGNWPFSSAGPADRRYNQLSPSLHDYFFLKALDQVRPGGLVVGITSRYTLDGKATGVRQALARKADLVAAFRLPSGAFEEYAGTKVVTDVLILQKRTDEETNPSQVAWTQTDDMKFAGGGEAAINRYYHDHPENVLGTLVWGSGTTYGRAGVIVDRPADLATQLEQLVARLPAGVYQPASNVPAQRYLTNNTQERQRAVVVGPDDGLYQIQGERMVALEDATSYRIKDAKKTATREAQVRALVGIRQAYGALIDSERDGADNTEALRKTLKGQYDAFVAAHGPVRKAEGMAILKRIEDPFYPSLMALEREKDGVITPMPILERSVMRRPARLDNPSIRDAYVLARNQGLVLDMAAIGKLAKVTPEAAAQELIKAGAIFRTPAGGYEPTDVYLGGNVRRKLREAQAAAEQGEDMARNIAALKKVIPPTVPYFNIEARLGAQWVAPRFYRDFVAEELLGTADQAENIELEWRINRWVVKPQEALRNSATALRWRNIEARNAEGEIVDREVIPFRQLVEAAFNNGTMRFTEKDSDGNTVVREALSAAANEKAGAIREAFEEWIWKSPERKVALERDYNEVMNAIASPQFDGSFLAFEGMALQRGENEFSLRSHQSNAIWRGLVQGAGLYAHEVGVGKTFVMAGIAVESRRFGLAKKPLILAHNANSASVAAEIQEMYPGAKVLYVNNLQPKRIKETLAQIRNDDWDAVVMPHSLLDRLTLKGETLQQLAAEEIAALEAAFWEAMNEADNQGTNPAGFGRSVENFDIDDADAIKKLRNPTAKELATARLKIQERILRQSQESSRADAVTFEDLGVDMLMVDECFTHDTLVETDQGLLKIGDIVEQRLSVQVKSVDSSTHVVQWKPVVNWYANPLRAHLIEVFHESGSFVCTPNHKIWVAGHGYKLAGELGPTDRLVISGTGHQSSGDQARQKGGAGYSAMRVVQDGVFVSETQESEFLLRVLQNAGATGQPSIGTEVPAGYAGNLGKLPIEGENQPGVVATNDAQQSDAEPGNPGTHDANPEGQRAPSTDSRREWATADATATVVGRLDRDGPGIRHQDAGHLATDGAPATPLQGRPGGPGTAIGGGDRREQPQHPQGSGTGPQEGSGLVTARVVGVAILQRGSDGEYRFGGRVHSVVYDIEVADNHNYFANGVRVSNCHLFKKPPMATRMKMRGLQKQLSNRSVALKFLTDYVKNQNSGRGVHLFTGTPITNTLAEIFHMQRYVMQGEMKRDGIGDWDGWFNTFATGVSDVEFTAAGDYQPVTKLAGFINVAELRRMMSPFMDVVFADQMPEFTPRQTTSGKTLAATDLTDTERDYLTNGREENPVGRPYRKVIMDVAEMSPEQQAILSHLQFLADEWRNADGMTRRAWMLEGDPHSPIMIEGAAARAGMDARMEDLALPDYPENKINRAVGNIMRHYLEEPMAGQVVFMDKGYSDTRTVRGERVPGLNMAKELRAKLIAAGIPEKEIAIVAGGVTPEQKKAVADAVNAGKVRVVIGQTETLGTGVNMQQRLRAMHHLDAPWMPGELEQRNGRGWRQGNSWNTVMEYRYITERIDGKRWQVLAVKDRFIKAFLQADADTRVIEGDAVSDEEGGYAETLSEAVGDPRLLQRQKLKADLDKLNRRERTHAQGMVDAREQLARIKRQIPEKTALAATYRGDAALFAEAEQEAARQQQAQYRARLDTYLQGLGIDLTATERAALQAEGWGSKQQDRALAKRVQAAVKAAEAEGRQRPSEPTTQPFAGQLLNDRFTTRDEMTDAFKSLGQRMPQNATGFVDVGEVFGFRLQAKRLSREALALKMVSNTDAETSYTLYTLNATVLVNEHLRNLRKRADAIEQEVTAAKADQSKLTELAQQPFARADELARKRDRLAEIEADMALNPVPAPAWLRHGAPLDSQAYWRGKPVVVEGHQWSDDGYFVHVLAGEKSQRVPYLEIQDANGAPVYEPHDFTAPVSQTAAAPAAAADTPVFSRSTPGFYSPLARGIAKAKSAAMPAGQWRNWLKANAANLGIKQAEIDQVLTNGLPLFAKTGGAATGASPTAVRAAVNRITSKWKNAPRMVVFTGMDDPQVDAAVRREYARQTKERLAKDPNAAPDQVDAFYFRGTVYINSESIANIADVERALRHETLGHAGLRALFGNTLDGILDQVIAGQGAAVAAKAKQRGLDMAKINEARTAAEEVLAELAETRPHLAVVRRAVALIRRLLRELGITLELSNNDIIAEYLIPARNFIERGQRQGAGTTGGMVPAFMKRDQTQTQAFKNWFKDSKVVDQDGKPLVVYHGTGADFAAFDVAKSSNSSRFGPGLYFTGDSRTFDTYGGRDGGNVMPVYLQIKNPQVNSALTEPQIKAFFGALQDKVFPNGYDATEDHKSFMKLALKDPDGAFDTLLSAQVVYISKADWLRGMEAMGVDGIIMEVFGHPEYVVFKPNQIKSAIGNTGAFDPNNDDIRFSLSPRQNQTLDSAWQKLSLAPERSKTLTEHIRGLLGKDWGQAKRDLLARANEGMLDGLINIDRAEQEVGITQFEQRGYISTRMAAGKADVMWGVLNKGAPEWRNGVLTYKRGTQGLLKTLGDLGPDMRDWLGWMAGNRAQELLATDREHNLDEAEIAELIALATPANSAKFLKAKAEYSALNNAMLDVAEQAGLIDPAARAQWQSEWYVPFYRVRELDGEATLLGPHTKGGLSHQSSGIRALKGGEAPTGDLLENILTNWMKLLDASLKNHALEQISTNLTGTRFMADETSKWKQVFVSKTELLQRLKEDPQLVAAVADWLGANTGDVEYTLKEVQKLTRRETENLYAQVWTKVAPEGKDIVRVQRNGANHYYKVLDPALLRSIESFGFEGFNDPLTRTARTFKRLLTTGVTAMPDFIIRNFVRDAVQAWTINPDKMKFASSAIKGLRRTYGESDAYWDLIFSGGAFQGGYAHGTDPDASAQMIRRSLGRKGMSPQQIDAHQRGVLSTASQVWGALDKYWEKYRAWGDKAENVNRLATYEAAIAAGKSPLQAAFEAKDLMDYSLRGNYQALMRFTDMVPFLNARIQGLGKLGRAGLADPRAVGMKLAKIAGFSVALALLNGDDDRYKELEDWKKDAYWHFWLGDEHVMIPKPFEIGVLAGTLPERLWNVFAGDQENEKLWWSVKHNLMGTFSFNPIPQIALPLIENVANRSFFFDRPIENLRDLGQLPSNRFDSRTSDSMRVLGSWLGTSPKQMEHLINGYLGTLGMYVLGLSDAVVRWGTDAPEKPDAPLSAWPVLRSFYGGSGPARNTVYATDLYDAFQEVEAIHRTINDMRKEKRLDQAKALQTKEAPKLRLRPQILAAKKRLDEINRSMNLITASTMTGTMKRQRIDRLTLEKNRLSQKVAGRIDAAF